MFVYADPASFVRNGQLNGPIANGLRMVDNRGSAWFDPQLRRPFIGTRTQKPCFLVNRDRYGLPKSWTTQDSRGGEKKPIMGVIKVSDFEDLTGIRSPVANATVLSKEQWIHLDTTLELATRYPLRLWADLQASVPYSGFNAMATPILEYQALSDPGMAMVDMSGTTMGNRDPHSFQLRGLPLPITHMDFDYDQRVLMTGRIKGTPLEVAEAEAAGRRIGETIECTAIGNLQGITYGGNSTQIGGYDVSSTVYGLLNFPSRQTYTQLQLPSTGGYTVSQTVADVLACLQQLRNNKFFGPFMVYHSNDWDNVMDNDYILTGGNVATQTLRNRLRAIPDIRDVRRLDMLFATPPTTNTLSTNPKYLGPTPFGLTANPYTLIFVQLTPGVIQAVDGMGITTVQWEEVGGMRVVFKVMAIQVPRVKMDFYKNTGILVAN